MLNVNELLQEVIGEARGLNIPVSNNINKEVKINTRAKWFGQCKFNKITGKYDVELTDRLLRADKMACKQTLAHEILHTCLGCMNHGRAWKTYAARLNNKYGYNITRANTCSNLGIEDTIVKNYAIQCQKCGKIIYREKLSKAITNTDRFHCKCGGSLKRII